VSNLIVDNVIVSNLIQSDDHVHPIFQRMTIN